MEKLTFKQYRESKEHLLKSMANAPVSVIEYEIQKYCSLSIGSMGDVRILELKPKQSIIIEWKHTALGVATLDAIRLVGINGINEQDIQTTSLPLNKLKTWLARNANAGQNRSYIK